MNQNIERKIQNASSLPPVLNQFYSLIQSKYIDYKKIESLMKSYPRLLNEMINIGKATCYGTPHHIKNIEGLVNLLGKDIVNQTLLISCMKPILSSKLSYYHFEENQLWQHCICSALLSQQLSLMANFHIEPFQAFLGGFLADIGKIILDEELKEHKSSIEKKLDKNDCLFDELEEETLGINHAQISATLAENWGLDSALSQAIKYHHNPEEAENNYELATIIHIASNLSIIRGNGIGKEGLHYKLCDHAVKKVGLDINDIEKTFAETYPIINEALLSTGENHD